LKKVFDVLLVKEEDLIFDNVKLGLNTYNNELSDGKGLISIIPATDRRTILIVSSFKF